MRKLRAFCFTMAASTLLASCSLKVHTDDFYKVEYYSDYVGVDEDLAAKKLDKNKATLIGHSYILRESISISGNGSEATSTVVYNKAGEPTYLDTDYGEPKNTEYKTSKRQAPEGHEWVFKKWAGFYDDGTEINMDAIKADCAVFAIYEARPINYSVSISGLNGETQFYTVPYGKTLLDNEDYLANRIAADPVSYFADPYYQTSILNGLSYFVNDVDRSSEVTGAPYVNFIENTEIRGKTRFEYKYADPVKHSYTVRYKAINEADSSVLVDWTEKSVEYDQPIPKPGNELIPTAQWSYIKCIGNYPEEAKEYNPELDVVDPECVRYHCEVILVYRKKAPQFTVHVYNETGTAIKNDVLAYEGAPAVLPSPTLDDASLSWTGQYCILGTTNIYEPATLITGDISLVPVAVALETEKVVAVMDEKYGAPVDLTFKYIFNRGYGGYCFAGIADGGNALKDDSILRITPNMIEYTNDANYPHLPFNATAIQAIAGSKVAQTIYEIAIPNTIVHIQGTAYRGCTNISTLDFRTNTNLISIGNYAFDRLATLGEIYLPASLQTVGSRIVNDCRNIGFEKLFIPFTQAEVEAKIQSGDFSETWNYIDKDHAQSVKYGYTL